MDQSTAAQATSAQQPTFADEHTELSAFDAFRAINRREIDDDSQKDATPPDGDVGASEQDSAQADAATAGDDQQPSGDDDGQDDTGDKGLPPIAPPASWTKEQKKAWETLPRDLQESLAEHERVRRTDIDRRLNEAAQRERAAQARMQAAEQARKQYEAQIPVLQQAIQKQLVAEFSDIKTWDDVRKMAAEDPIRYGQWDAMLKQHRFAAEQQQAIQARQQQERATRAREYFNEQARLFAERAPEFADPQKAGTLRAQAFEVLQDFGFAPDEINDAWTKGGSIPVHDHRFQLLVREAMRLRSAEKAVKKPVAKPAPQVQRPGPAVTSKDQRSEHVKTLDSRLSKSGSIKDAFALLRAAR